jgi:hypothetical protein
MRFSSHLLKKYTLSCRFWLPEHNAKIGQLGSLCCFFLYGTHWCGGTIGTIHLYWNNSTLVKEVVPEDIAQLKREPGRDMLIYCTLLLGMSSSLAITKPIKIGRTGSLLHF